jgi:hypothetical protein
MILVQIIFAALDIATRIMNSSLPPPVELAEPPIELAAVGVLQSSGALHPFFTISRLL